MYLNHNFDFYASDSIVLINCNRRSHRFSKYDLWKVAAMDLASLSVEETAEFVSQTLDIPDLASMFRDQEVDGMTMLELTVSTIRDFLPGVTLGKCHKFFRNLKSFQKDQGQGYISSRSTASPPRSPSSPPRSPSPPPRSPSPPPRSPSPPPRSPSPPPRSPSPPPAFEEDIATPSRVTAAPVTGTTPIPKDFPIERANFSPDAVNMIKTGQPTIAGKTAITNAVVSLMQKYSTSPGYASFQLKRMAATALVYNFPNLEMGMGVSNAVKCWHTAITEKLKNWRKRGKVEDPHMEQMKTKYRAQGGLGKVPHESRKRRGSQCRVLTDEESQELEEHRQLILTECQKPVRSRNLRLLDHETDVTFPLRRQLVLRNVPHAQALLRDWPSLKLESILLKEICRIVPTANSYTAFSAKFRSFLPRLMQEARQKAVTLESRHALPELMSSIPFVDETDPDYDFDLNIIGAVIGLTYILPTTTKKQTQAHRHVVDFSESAVQEVANEVPTRKQPFIQVVGTPTDRRKIVLFTDQCAVCTCSDMTRAIYLLLTMFYVLDVAYPPVVSTTLEFLQITTLGIVHGKPHVRAMDLAQRLSLR